MYDFLFQLIRRVALAAAPFAIAVCGFSAAAHAEGTSIQMLPPISCPNGTSGILSWDSTNPLGCVAGFTANSATGSVAIGGAAVAGNVLTVNGAVDINGAINISGATQISGVLNLNNALAPLTGNDVNVLHLLETQACPPGQSLIATNGGTFSCQAFDVGALPPTPPACTGANMLQFDGTNYQCVVAPNGGGGNNGNSMYVIFDGTSSPPNVLASSSGIAHVIRYPYSWFGRIWPSGVYEIDFSSPMPNTNYTVSGTATEQANGTNAWIIAVEKHTNYVLVETGDDIEGTLTPVDSPNVSVVIGQTILLPLPAPGGGGTNVPLNTPTAFNPDCVYNVVTDNGNGGQASFLSGRVLNYSVGYGDASGPNCVGGSHASSIEMSLYGTNLWIAADNKSGLCFWGGGDRGGGNYVPIRIDSITALCM